MEWLTGSVFRVYLDDFSLLIIEVFLCLLRRCQVALYYFAVSFTNFLKRFFFFDGFICVLQVWDVSDQIGVSAFIFICTVTQVITGYVRLFRKIDQSEGDLDNPGFPGLYQPSSLWAFWKRSLKVKLTCSDSNEHGFLAGFSAESLNPFLWYWTFRPLCFVS